MDGVVCVQAVTSGYLIGTTWPGRVPGLGLSLEARRRVKGVQFFMRERKTSCPSISSNMFSTILFQAQAITLCAQFFHF